MKDGNMTLKKKTPKAPKVIDETKKIFTKQELRDMDMPYSAPDGGEIVYDKIYDTSRWSEMHEMVVQFKDQMGTDEAWYFTYSRGLTECQDESPWEFDDEIEAHLVKKITKTVEVWE